MTDQEPKGADWLNSAMSTIVGAVLVVFGGLWLLAGAPLKSLPLGLLTVLTFVAFFAWFPLYVWVCQKLGVHFRKGSWTLKDGIAALGLLFTWAAWASLVDQAYDYLLPSFAR